MMMMIEKKSIIWYPQVFYSTVDQSFWSKVDSDAALLLQLM